MSARMLCRFALVALPALAGCNARPSLLRTRPEPPGANCASGGTAVQSGVDKDGNGVLGDGEVDASRTRYVCNNASTTAATLNLPAPEPAGPNCAYGGTRIQSGQDKNNDGVLEPSEVSSTAYVCDGQPASSVALTDVTVTSPADLQELAGVDTFLGSLTLTGSFGDATHIDGVKTVLGTLTVSSLSVTGDELRFPDLEQASQVIVHDLTGAKTLSFPVLARASVINFYDLPDLTVVDLAQLGDVQGVGLLNAPNLFVYDAPKMNVWEHLEFDQAPNLSLCTFEHLVNQSTAYPGSAWADLAIATCKPADFCHRVTGLGLSRGDQAYQCTQPSSVADARTFCGQLGSGGDLIWFESASELTAFQRSMATFLFWIDSWVGYSDTAAEGTWTALSGFTGYDPTTSGFWAPGNPNGGNAQNGARAVTQDGHMEDAAVTDLNPFICRVP